MGFSCQIFTWTSQDFPSTVDIVMCYFRKGAFRITLSVFWMKSLCILVLEIISGIDMFIFNRTLNHFCFAFGLFQKNIVTVGYQISCLCFLSLTVNRH